MAEARRARAEDISQLVALSDRIFRKPGQASMGTAFSQLFSAQNADHLLVVEEADMPVSLVGLLPGKLRIEGCEIPIASMGSVCTDPEYRMQKFAARLVEMGIRQIEAEGAVLLLVSGSRSLYKRYDCLEVGEMQKFRFHPDALQTESFSSGAREQIEIRTWQPDDIPAMLSVLQSEGIYYERTPQEFLELIQADSYLSCIPLKQQLFIRKASGVLDSYLVFGLRTGDEDGIGYAEVVEFAGQDEAVLQLLQEVGTRGQIQEIRVAVPNYRKQLADRLALSGCGFRSETIPGTIRMINFPAFWNHLKPYLTARLGTETAEQLRCDLVSNGYRISLGSESLVLDRCGATRLAFQGPSWVEDSELRSALSRIFPIPFVYPQNLNYV